MNIDFHTPKHEVHSWIINYVKDQLVQLHQKDKSMSKAEVFFCVENPEDGGHKICEIALAIFGDSVFLSRGSDSFEKASRLLMDAVKKRLDEHTKLRNEPPDLITSTVKV